MALFAQSELFGTFKGFAEHGFEFAADIVARYNANMLDRPQLGQFLLIELGGSDEAALGRITRFAPTGILATSEAEDYMITMQARGNEVPEDLKRDRLKYRVQIKLLGAVREVNGKVMYVPSQRRLPHLGAKVALPSKEVLAVLCKLGADRTDKGIASLGYYVLGEYTFSGTEASYEDAYLRPLDPQLEVTFNMNNLVSRRTVVFARAGYGKSNLMKYLLSELYRHEPEVGTLVFDADGEYFWPDKKGRPGLCDVPFLNDKLYVFTNRTARNSYYHRFKAGEIKLDIRELPARDVVGIGVASERQTQQNVLKLKSLRSSEWKKLVDLIHKDGLAADDESIARILGYTGSNQQVGPEIGAAKSNMNALVRLLHDPKSKLLTVALQALKRGAIVIMDISLLSSAAGNMLAGLLLRRIFSFNQENFTGGKDSIRAIAVIEEAQSVLGRNLDESSPFVEWVKEGRKYDLGAILITQQPGSMSPELLSQADNWFSFHLLSEVDASTLGKYNSHYSNDILSYLIAEPISGNCFMWSAPHQPFVLPVRVHSFEAKYRQFIKAEDEEIECAAVTTGQTNDVDAEHYPSMESQMGQPAQQLLKEAADALTALAEAVRNTIKSDRLYPLTYNGVSVLGIKQGRVWHVINDKKSANEVRSDEELKDLVMKELLGSEMCVVENDSLYYCASHAAWERAFGAAPKIRDNIAAAHDSP